MRTLHILKVAFDAPIYSGEIPAFRAALDHRMKRRNRSETAGNYYPLIQYKMRHSQTQQQPLLVCLGPHPDFFRQLSQQTNWTANLHGRNIKVEVAYTKSTTYQLQECPRLQQYQLFRYQALNSDNYQQYRSCETEAERRQLLEKLIRAHIICFADSIDWDVKDMIEVRLTHLIRQKLIAYQGIQARCFDLAFECNLFLPEYISLGKGINSRFGVLRKKRIVKPLI